MILLLVLIPLFTLSFSQTINCKNPTSNLQQQYCNIQHLIELYNRKLKILEQSLSINQSSSQPLSLLSPYPSSPNLFIYNTLFTGQTILIPPQKLLNQHIFRTKDGKQISQIQYQGDIIATDNNEITLHSSNKIKKITFKPKSKTYSQSQEHGVYEKGIRGFYLGKSPKVLVQYNQKQLWIASKAGIYKNYTFEKEILSVSLGYNGEFIYVTKAEYGVISILNDNYKNQSFMYGDILNATSDRNVFLYILTDEGKLITIDIKTNQEIGTSLLFPGNNVKTDMTVCDNKLIIHRETEPYLLVYNTTDKGNVKVAHNITVCKENYKRNDNIKYRYQIGCYPNTLFLLCGSGEGENSQWKYGRYQLLQGGQHSSFNNSKYVYPGIAAVIFLFFFIFKNFFKKKINPKIIQEEREENSDEELMGKITGNSAKSKRSKKNN